MLMVRVYPEITVRLEPFGTRDQPDWPDAPDSPPPRKAMMGNPNTGCGSNSEAGHAAFGEATLHAQDERVAVVEAVEIAVVHEQVVAAEREDDLLG